MGCDLFGWRGKKGWDGGGGRCEILWLRWEVFFWGGYCGGVGKGRESFGDFSLGTEWTGLGFFAEFERREDIELFTKNSPLHIRMRLV